MSGGGSVHAITVTILVLSQQRRDALRALLARLDEDALDMLGVADEHYDELLALHAEFDDAKAEDEARAEHARRHAEGKKRAEERRRYIEILRRKYGPFRVGDRVRFRSRQLDGGRTVWGVGAVATITRLAGGESGTAIAVNHGAPVISGNALELIEPAR